MGGGGIEPQALHAVARSCCAPEVALQTPLRNSETVILKLMARTSIVPILACLRPFSSWLM